MITEVIFLINLCLLLANLLIMFGGEGGILNIMGIIATGSGIAVIVPLLYRRIKE